MTEEAGEAAIEGLSFEEALKQLEQIVRSLETGETPLAEAIAVYERGNRLRQHCSRLLNQAKERIEKINLDADGNPSGGTSPLD